MAFKIDFYLLGLDTISTLINLGLVLVSEHSGLMDLYLYNALGAKTDYLKVLRSSSHE